MDDSAVAGLVGAVAASTPQAATDSLAVIVARMETKLDIVINQHATQLTDHEARLRHIEQINPIGWKALFGGIGSGLGIAAVAISVMSALHIPL